ncbi:endoglucanase-like isoform X2 [Dreissena polymorpha]|nr:endoglucanase-like isoform X2 [Dreissena polymorpha]XP_052227818.1 endoglucanase-like isoform X2 [Dreissena polymorpha]XP_052227819.1 endoglucanase-like isoform X2 [Dreissena polymorpha]
MYHGKKCASTTRYVGYRMGACGCGTPNNDTMFPWSKTGWAVAANQALFDAGGAKWCGQSCGKCVKLTTTGGFVDGQGHAPAENQSHVFMITNLCPNTYPNLSWCSQQASNGGVNQYGYGWHFDLENANNQITGMDWGNPEVTWEWADCDAGHAHDSRTPSNSNYHTCQCGHHGKK